MGTRTTRRDVTTVRSIAKDQRGTSTSEFLVLLVCIAIAAIAAWQFMGRMIVSMISGDDPHAEQGE